MEKDFDFADAEFSANIEAGSLTKLKGGKSNTVGLLGHEFNISALAVPKDMRYSVLLGTMHLGLAFPVTQDGVNAPIEKLKGLIELGFNYRLFDSKCTPVASAGLKLSAQLIKEITEKHAALKFGAGMFCQFSKNVALIIIYNPIQAHPSVSTEDSQYNVTKFELKESAKIGNTHGVMMEAQFGKYVRLSGRYDQFKNNQTFYQTYSGRMAVRIPMFQDPGEDVGAMNVFVDGGGLRIQTPGLELQGHYFQGGIGIRY